MVRAVAEIACYLWLPPGAFGLLGGGYRVPLAQRGCALRAALAGLQPNA